MIYCTADIGCQSVKQEACEPLSNKTVTIWGSLESQCNGVLDVLGFNFVMFLRSY